MRGTLRRVFCNVRAYVSCRGYVGTLLRAQPGDRMRIKVATRIKDLYSSLAEAASARGVFASPLAEAPKGTSFFQEESGMKHLSGPNEAKAAGRARRPNRRAARRWRGCVRSDTEARIHFCEKRSV